MSDCESEIAALKRENTRLQEEAALYRQRYQEKAAESQTWAAKAGAHAAENTPLQEALRSAADALLAAVGVMGRVEASNDAHSERLSGGMSAALTAHRAARALLEKPCPDCGGPADHVHPQRAASDNTSIRKLGDGSAYFDRLVEARAADKSDPIRKPAIPLDEHGNCRACGSYAHGYTNSEATR